MEDLDTYLKGDFPRIKGWCNPRLWDCVKPLARSMREFGETGPVGEIGVQNGKFFIGLVKISASPGPHLAVDLFDLPLISAEISGRASRADFEANLGACSVPLDSVEIREADSLWLSDTDVRDALDRSGGYSWFSIDGSRDADRVFNDLAFAMRVTRPIGAIFVDDYYNPNWPGVQEGVSRHFFANPAARFVPLLYTANKLVLCSRSWHDRYLYELQRALRDGPSGAIVKRVRRFGVDTLTVHPRPS